MTGVDMAKWIQLLRSRISSLIDRFESEPTFRLYSLAVSVFLLLIAGGVLASSSPIRLLVPGLNYQITATEKRKQISYYTLSRHDQSLLQIEEQAELSGNFDTDARHLAYIVRMPFPLIKGKARPSAPAYFFPALDLGINRIWIQKNQAGKTELIIDIDSAFIKKALEQYRKSGGADDAAEAAKIARMYQVCLTLTFFENYTDVDQILYMKDGNRQLTDTVTQAQLQPKANRPASTVEPFDFSKIYVR